MISLPKPPKIIEEKGNRAVFEIEALYPGYGVTVGNSLRRVLLSSLPGAAVTEMKIKGIQHDFSTISGVLEDVVEIMLNLKQLRFKIFTDEPQKAKLKVRGEKAVKGSDFKLPAQVELINKDASIATLTSKKAELEMEIQIEKGFGYQTVEQRKKEKLGIGVIALDAIFTPIKKVNFRVENMRVVERTDYDRLFLDIETDGTIKPKEALFLATKTLLEHFSLFVGALESKEKAPVEKKPAFAKAIEDKKTGVGKKKVPTDLAKTNVEDLKISLRTSNALLKNNIRTVGGLLRKTEETLLKLEGMGEGGVKEIKKTLKKLGLELK